jgi:hypothetical protein
MKKDDTVRLINGVNKMPAGAIGTITWVYEGVDAYDVLFEFRSRGFDEPNLNMTVHGTDMEKVEKVPTPLTPPNTIYCVDKRKCPCKGTGLIPLDSRNKVYCPTHKIARDWPQLQKDRTTKRILLNPSLCGFSSGSSHSPY